MTGPGLEAGAEDDLILVTIDGIWAACPDVGPGDVGISNWTLRQPDTGPCAEQPEDERWYAYRISRLPGDRVDQQRVFDPITAWLEGEGFAVRRYRAPLSGRLELRAHRVAEAAAGAEATVEAVAVIAAVSTNGATSVQVFAGPCARFVGDEHPGGLERLGS